MKFTLDEILALEKLAKVSKMDCWFSINDKERVYDLEENRTMSSKVGVSQLLEGATNSDLENIGIDNVQTIIGLLIKNLK